MKCPEGFAPELYYCKNICGDGYIANDPTGINNEDCDDMNNSNLDGCINCRFDIHSNTCYSHNWVRRNFPEYFYY